MALFKKFPAGMYRAVNSARRKRKIFLSGCALCGIGVVWVCGLPELLAIPAAVMGFVAGVWVIKRSDA